MSYGRAWFLLPIVVLLAAVPVAGADEEWREDVEFLIREFPARHADLFAVVPEKNYRAQAEALLSSVERLEEWQVVCGMTALLALARDGHTSLGIHGEAAGFHFLPLRLHSFADGWFIFEASEAYEELIGKKVVSVGGIEIEEAFARLAHYVGSPTDSWARTYADISVFVHELMRCEGLAHEGPVVLGLADGEGTTEVTVATVPWKERRPLGYGTPPMARMPPPEGVAADAPYWYRWLSDSGTLYVQFNSVEMNTDDPLPSFGQRLQAFSETVPVERTVIDVRDNGGGNNFLPRVWVDRISRSETINREGRLFTLLSRRTFSAAINFVSMMEMRTKTIFVGEPTPEAPNSYGDAESMELPRSGISVRISTLWWQGTIPEDTRPAIEPRLAAAPTYDEYLEGCDPVLEAALAYKPESRLSVNAKTRRRIAKKIVGEYSFRGRAATIEEVAGRLWLHIDPPESRSFFKVRTELTPLRDGTLATDITGVTMKLGDSPTVVWRRTEILLVPRNRE